MVEKRTRVIVYGSTLNMAGIAASLKTDAGLEVIWVDPHSADVCQRLKEIEPAAIAFDMSGPSPVLDVTILRECPGLLLIGVDPSKDELLVLSSYPAQATSISDLIQIIYQISKEI
jgi:hypothetical protein